MQRLLSRLLGISRGMLEWLLPLLRSAAASSLERLMPIALQIVSELATSSQPGSEKRDLAVAKLSKAAYTEGLLVGNQVLNLAVELAVARLRAEARQ